MARRLPYEALIAGLREAFSQDIHVPMRSMYPIEVAPGSHATFGLMPARCSGEILVIKAVAIFPENTHRSLSTIHAQIVVFDGKTGIPTAIIDGTEVTRRRTAATSALAASYLANMHAEYLVVVGTGEQALH